MSTQESVGQCLGLGLRHKLEDSIDRNRAFNPLKATEPNRFTAKT